MSPSPRIRQPGEPPRLLLVYPATEQLGWVRRFQLPSLSLQMVAAATPAAWEVVLADEIHEQVPFDGDFDLVGITAMTHQATRAYQIADQFRAQGVPVVLGGMHPTVLPDEALCHADAVVVGEAEPVWEGLLADLLAGRLAPLYRAPIATVKELVLPPARRDILAGRQYLTTQTVQASRGCPYDCAFCTVTNYFGNQFRYRATDALLAELQSFPGRLTVFLDDNLLGDAARIRPVLEQMAGMRLRWGAQASLRFAEDPELVRLVARAGCIGIFVGIESVVGSQANHPKTGSRATQMALIKRIQDAGIIVEASMIFGFDDHDESVFDETLRFVAECGPSVPTFHVLTPYPGTALFEQFDREGRLLHKEWSRYNHSEVVYRPKLMTPERLYQGWVEARREAYSMTSILGRVARQPGSRLVSFTYNLLRKGPNDRLAKEYARQGMPCGRTVAGGEAG